jgi:hypothetical protein
MLLYFVMLALPGSLALTGRRAGYFSLLLIGLIYSVLIGLRFQVGMDWNNYVDLYNQKHGWSLSKFAISREPGFGILTWVSIHMGWGPVFINAVSAIVFCWGFFAIANRCKEPWIAITIATPLLVIAFAMSGVRQAIAVGIVFYLIAHWRNYHTIVRIILVMLASAFHFSAIFMMIFVALGSRVSDVVRIGGAIFTVIFIAGVINFSPESVEAYSRLYVASGGKLTAPGAIYQISPLVGAALIYLVNRGVWTRSNGDEPLNHSLAWTSFAALASILVSSVGAYRFALYIWPMAMQVYSGVPSTIESAVGRLFYRLVIVAAAFALLLGWLLLANNSYAWIPYRNWLNQPDSVILWRSHYR